MKVIMLVYVEKLLLMKVVFAKERDMKVVIDQPLTMVELVKGMKASLVDMQPLIMEEYVMENLQEHAKVQL